MSFLGLLATDPLRWHDLDALAAAVGLSRWYFARRFRSEMGMTAKRFQLEAKMRQAHYLLSAGWTVQAVAARLGYADAFVLSRQFKAVIGCAPSHVPGAGPVQG